ncbi:MAG: hypothetical protein ACK4ZY_00670 [Sphingomonas sp.]
MVVEEEALRDRLAQALEEADRCEDTLIAALLSQCLALLDDRAARVH